MSKDLENDADRTSSEDAKFETSPNSRAGWLLIGGFVAALVLLLGAELLRRM